MLLLERSFLLKLFHSVESVVMNIRTSTLFFLTPELSDYLPYYVLFEPWGCLLAEDLATDTQFDVAWSHDRTALLPSGETFLSPIFNSVNF